MLFNAINLRLVLALPLPVLGLMSSLMGATGESLGQDVGELSRSTASIEAGGWGMGDVWIPSLHVRGGYGWSTADSGQSLRTGSHDPELSGWNAPTIEAGLSFRPNAHFETTAIYHAYFNEDDQLRGEWEEVYARVRNLPENIEWRFGKFLPVATSSNHIHLHQSSFVDYSLMQSRFLGEHGLRGLGGEVSWSLPTPFDSLFTFSLIHPESHSHGHGMGEIGHDHGGEMLAHEESHGSFEEDWVAFLRYQIEHAPSDFHRHRVGLSYGFGPSLSKGMNQLLSLDYAWKWRENGLEKGGKSLSWKTEVMARQVQWRGHTHGEGQDHAHHDSGHSGHHDHAHDHEHDDHKHDDLGSKGRGEREHSDESSMSEWEFGMGTELIYQFHPQWESALRMEYVSGLGDLELDERFRVSPAITWYLNESKNLHVRVQYHWDHSPEWGNEHSVWAQFGFSWGGH